MSGRRKTARIAVFGGSFNPPGLHHLEIARRLGGHFDQVLVIPCGPRPDKPTTNDVDPVYRSAMVDMTFRGLEKVSIERFDLEQNTFTRTWDLEKRLADRGELWHVVGTDLVQGGAEGRSAIQRGWFKGETLWKKLRFAVVKRPGFRAGPEDLPPHSELFEIDYAGSSDTIRNRIFRHQDVSEFVTPEVADYIDRHGLYRGVPPMRVTRLRLPSPRYMIIADPGNPKARAAARGLKKHRSDDPNLIVVIGGDGTMLRAIRQHWELRLPFFGYNTGHRGFLLNPSAPSGFDDPGLVSIQLPLLWVETTAADGTTRSSVAFNDAWVERSTGQTAWIQVRLNGRERLSQLVADGALVATAAGSTSYARAMGATSLPLNTPSLLLVGSNVLKPEFWKPVVLPLDSVVELVNLDPSKRPLRAFIDGVPQGEVVSVRARVSNTANVELAFDPELDPAEKLAQIQFPPL